MAFNAFKRAFRSNASVPNIPKLNVASSEGDIKAVRTLLELDPSIIKNKELMTRSLSNAVKNGHTDIVTLLIKNGADVNAKDHTGERPLHLAAQNGYWEILELLIKNGADAKLMNDRGDIPLHSALRNKGNTDSPPAASHSSGYNPILAHDNNLRDKYEAEYKAALSPGKKGGKRKTTRRSTMRRRQRRRSNKNRSRRR